MIKQIVEPSYFSDATILTVVNTVHVKAAWQAPFDRAVRKPRRSGSPAARSCRYRP